MYGWQKVLNMPKNPEFDREKSLFDSIDQTRIDPAFRDFLTDVMKAQSELDECDELDLDDAMGVMNSLNDLWEDLAWYQRHCTLTGKIRLVPGHDASADCLTGFVEENNPCKDDTGQLYYDAVDLTFVAAGFTLNIDHDEGVYLEKPKIVFSFITEQEFAIKSVDGDINYEGCLMMLPDDIDAIAFDEPSPQAVEQYIAYHYPDVHEYLVRSVPQGDVGYRRMKNFFNHFSIELTELVSSDPHLKEYIETYIYNCLQFNDDLYAITTKADIVSYDNQGHQVSSFSDGRLKRLHAAILQVTLREDFSIGNGIYVPHLIIAQPERDAEGQYSVIEVDGPTLEGIRNLQNTVRYFGSSGVKLFDYLGDARSFASSLANSKTASTRYKADEDSLVRELLQDTLPDFTEKAVGYFTPADAYILDIKSDLQKVLQRYGELCGRIDDVQHDAHEQLAERMATEEIPFDQLKVGDTLHVTQAFVGVLLDSASSRTSALLVDNGYVLTGTFTSFIVTELPDTVSALTKGGVGAQEFQLGVIIDKAQLHHENGSADTLDQLVIVPLSGNDVPLIAKLQRHE